MEHRFDVSVAIEYSVIEAVIIRFFQQFISKDKANKENFLDEHNWTYNTMNAFKMFFPYLSENEIEYTINNLIAKGVLIASDDFCNFAFADEQKWLSEKF